MAGPANAALVSGSKTFNVTLKTAGSATVTATDLDDGSKTANTSPSITVNVGALAKLQLLVPGETAAPGTATGKTGTPSGQTAGTAFNVTVRSVDANWNLVSTNDTVAISSSDANAALPANAPLASGTLALSVTLKTAGSATVTASNVTHTAITINTSPPIAVNVGAVTKLQILLPGEVAAPGTAAGKAAATPTAQTAGTAITNGMVVNAVDANWNVVTSAVPNVTITSSDTNAIAADDNGGAAGNMTLAAGTGALSSFTFKTSGTRTVTATDAAATLTANTSANLTVNAGSFVKLQLLVPGETAAAGTANGKTGSPSAQTAGTGYSVTVNAVDPNWNVVTTATDTVGITSTDPNDVEPANAALVSGTKSFSLTNSTVGTWTVTATDVTNGGKTPYTSPPITVNAGAS